MSQISYPSVTEVFVRTRQLIIADEKRPVFNVIDIDVETDPGSANGCHSVDFNRDYITLIPQGSTVDVKLNLAGILPKLAKVNEAYNLNGVIDDLVTYVACNADAFDTEHNQVGYARAVVKMLEATREIIGVL